MTSVPLYNREHTGDDREVRSIRIRTLFSITVFFILAVGACRTNSPYFGRTKPPATQRLIFENAAEPGTLDPHRINSSLESRIIDALFDGLTKYHPETLEPMAALATHYETNDTNTRFTFYLRGHPQPRGTRLPNTDTLRGEFASGKIKEDFARGHTAVPDNIPARWSDGKIITAHDFIYSWRRLIDPQTAADNAVFLYSIKNAEKINTGKVRILNRLTGLFEVDSTGKEIEAAEKELKSNQKLSAPSDNYETVKFKPEDLAVTAPDDFTLQIELEAPAPFFLQMLSGPMFVPVPRQSIDQAKQRTDTESSWTQPEQIVTSGAFRLQKWKPYERIIVTKNPYYYEADMVAIEQITFLPIVDPTTNLNIYKAGEADAMAGNLIPQAFVQVLRGKRDFHTSASLTPFFFAVNTKKAPFDNTLLRYALNMATDKKAITDFLGSGQMPANTLVPSNTSYKSPDSLHIEINGVVYDILSYNPSAARELLSKAGFPDGRAPDGRRLSLDVLFRTLETNRQIAEIIQQQWQQNLNIEVNLLNQESKVYVRTIRNLQYNGVVLRSWQADYIDPNALLEVFLTTSVNSGTGWSSPQYDAMLKKANATTAPAERMIKLKECENELLKAMPVIPLFVNTNAYLLKPYVRGVGGNSLNQSLFKYVWIDVNWKPDSE